MVIFSLLVFGELSILIGTSMLDKSSQAETCAMWKLLRHNFGGSHDKLFNQLNRNLFFPIIMVGNKYDSQHFTVGYLFAFWYICNTQWEYNMNMYNVYIYTHVDNDMYMYKQINKYIYMYMLWINHNNWPTWNKYPWPSSWITRLLTDRKLT
jgi:hypothetical protein